MAKPVRNHVIYRPKKGKEKELLELVMKHGPALAGSGLIVDGPPVVYRAHNIRTNEDFFVEMFSWRDDKAANLAHQTPEIMAVWEPMTPILESLEISVIEPLSAAK